MEHHKNNRKTYCIHLSTHQVRPPKLYHVHEMSFCMCMFAEQCHLRNVIHSFIELMNMIYGTVNSKYHPFCLWLLIIIYSWLWLLNITISYLWFINIILSYLCHLNIILSLPLTTKCHPFISLTPKQNLAYTCTWPLIVIFTCISPMNIIYTSL